MAVPDVVGTKIAAAHEALRAAKLVFVSLNAACNKGTLTSQSVVDSLSVAGQPPDVAAGAFPLAPGSIVAPETRVGITWSGCSGDGAAVPSVVGLTFTATRKALHAAGLTWACFSVGRKTATTSTTTASTATSTASSLPVTTTTRKPPQTVVTQDPAGGAVVKPGTTVKFAMQACPQ